MWRDCRIVIVCEWYDAFFIKKCTCTYFSSFNIQHQCDQIGLFLKVLTNVALIISNFLGSTAVATSWVTFGNIWTFELLSSDKLFKTPALYYWQESNNLKMFLPTSLCSLQAVVTKHDNVLCMTLHTSKGTVKSTLTFNDTFVVMVNQTIHKLEKCFDGHIYYLIVHCYIKRSFSNLTFLVMVNQPQIP